MDYLSHFRVNQVSILGMVALYQPAVAEIESICDKE